MQVTNKSIAFGVTRAARQLGVCYNHLWKVLTGKYNSPSLVLKINRIMPSLFDTALCRINYKSIIRANKGRYIWDETKQRYVLKPFDMEVMK